MLFKRKCVALCQCVILNIDVSNSAQIELKSFLLMATVILPPTPLRLVRPVIESASCHVPTHAHYELAAY